jgi:hypothetical protein
MEATSRTPTFYPTVLSTAEATSRTPTFYPTVLFTANSVDAASFNTCNVYDTLNAEHKHARGTKDTSSRESHTSA